MEILRHAKMMVLTNKRYLHTSELLTREAKVRIILPIFTFFICCQNQIEYSLSIVKADA